MRLLITLLLALALLTGLGSYAHWIAQRPSSHYLSDLRSQVALDNKRRRAGAGDPGRSPRRATRR